MRIVEILRATGVPKKPHALQLVTRVEVYANTLHLLLPIDRLPAIKNHLGEGEKVETDLADTGQLRFIVPSNLNRRGGRTVVVRNNGTARKPDPVLVNALRDAHRIVNLDRSGLPVLECSPASPHARRIARLAFLSPDLQHAILSGRQPANLNLARLLESPFPLCWKDQARAFGMANLADPFRAI